MPHPRFSSEEIANRGELIYNNQIREQVETDENIGKIIAIDIETSEYSIGTDILGAGRSLFLKHPEAATWTKRIGYDAVYRI